MTTDRTTLWLDFCNRHQLGTACIPLFDSKEAVVSTEPLGRNRAPVLRRSEEMEAIVLEQAHLLREDYDKGADKYEGLIYCMYESGENERPYPLYIGKTEKYGKGDRNYSANLKGIKTGTSHPFARWGYNYAYHMGDLSRVVLGHGGKASAKYLHWAEELFERPFEQCKLKRPIFFWCKAWRTGDSGPWSEFGATSLTFLEYLLIGVASSEFPRLLNVEGRNRG